jgi:hypothetical protein
MAKPKSAIWANAEFMTQADVSKMERNDLYQKIRFARSTG